jgi:hypothetical protein
VIVYGNDSLAYSEYRRESSNSKEFIPQKRTSPDNSKKTTKEYELPLLGMRAPKIRLSFPQFEERQKREPLILHGEAVVRVDGDEIAKQELMGEKFEIVFYVDGKFVEEEANGYLPYNFPLNIKNLASGEHVLSVNLVLFNGKVAASHIAFMI